MNEIEQAIERISLIKRGCAKWIEGAYEIALAALREKQAREKGCEYCRDIANYKNEDLFNHLDRNMIYYKEDDGGKIKLFASVETPETVQEFSCNANFCICCGRELEVEP